MSELRTDRPQSSRDTATAATPEMRFLVQCIPSAAPYPLNNADPAIDWARLVDLAKWHGMFPLLASRLLSPRPEDTSAGAPATILALLRKHQAAYIHRSLSQTAALVELQREFDRHRIKVLAWKGPSAGLLLYGSATLRESADLDYLFLEEDVRQVLNITAALGYELLGKSESESKDIYILTRQREFTFGRRADQVMLEFHLQIMPARFALWQDSQHDIHRADCPYPVGDVELQLQRPEDLLVSLCAHATKHNWDRLKWSADIAQFLHLYGSRLDWASLLANLRAAEKHRVVLLGLALAEDLYGCTLPEPVLQALHAAPQLARLAHRLAAHLMSADREVISGRERKTLARLLCPRLRDRIAYILAPIVELNYEDLYVPVHHRLLFFMNYAFRVVRLLRKYGPQRLATKTAGSVRSVHSP